MRLEYTEGFLREIADSANAPDSATDDTGGGAFGVVEYCARDGWKVGIFYDAGELDYLDYFVTPNGFRIEAFDQHILRNWRQMEMEQIEQASYGKPKEIEQVQTLKENE